MIGEEILIAIQLICYDYRVTGCQTNKVRTTVGTVMITDMMAIVLFMVSMMMVIVVADTVLMLNVNPIGGACLPGNETRQQAQHHDE